MTRRISCTMTVEAVERMTKTVTRRHPNTWRTLKRGDELIIVEKAMGLKKGEKQRKLARVLVTDVRVEPICLVLDERYGLNECDLEGVPEMTPAEFETFWLKAHKYSWMCRRIEWRYIERLCPECHNWRDGTVPGWKRGSNWEFVPCGYCSAGFVEVDQ